MKSPTEVTTRTHRIIAVIDIEVTQEEGWQKGWWEVGAPDYLHLSLSNVQDLTVYDKVGDLVSDLEGGKDMFA
jgi:hypothetical protein